MKIALFTVCFLSIFTTSAYAELIQILHTNDLHSHLEHSVHQTDLGGYARLKTLLQKQRENAAEKGIPSIAMDAGDFMEGHIYYMADKGRKTFKAFEEIGHDVAVIGNHDYLMAASDLDGILRDVPPKYALLGANFKIDAAYTHINQHIKPVYETVLNGVKVGVIGITLNDFLYKWRLKGAGDLKNEIDTAREYAKYLRSRGNEIIVALTHIGLAKDKKLAKSVPEIDLIVGGHDHKTLHKIVYETSSNGKSIPIVQAGNHGEWLGKMLVDYDKKTKKLNIVHYQLLPVEGEVQDQAILDVIVEANDSLNSLYGKDWLNEVIGKSSLRPRTEANDDKIWHFFINDSMLESSKADFSVHASALSGPNYPIGDVTRRDLYNGNPRTFDFDDKYGYNIYTAQVRGIWIKLLATVCLNMNLPLYFSGIDFKWKKKEDGKYKVWNVTKGGKRIKLTKLYKVAFSEGVVRGGYAISKWVRFILHRGIRTESSMWQGMEEKFRREGELKTDYLDRYYDKNFIAQRKLDRVMIPVDDQ